MKWFYNAYLQIGLGALLVTASELMMKTGASAQAGQMGIVGMAALRSGWTWVGILCYCASFVSWVHVLRTVPLGIAYGLINIVHVLIPLGCRVFLNEAISPQRWLGIVLVLGGLLMIVKPLAVAEKKLEGL
jgi:multidrug transporter EmrE-like cation transporter